MKSLKLNFGAGGASLDLQSVCEDFDTTIQACLVNFGTSKNPSDKMFPTRGTDLLKQAVRGVLINPSAALHASNFASIDTVFFINEYGPASLDEKVRAIRPNVTTWDGEKLTVELQFVSSLNRVVGTHTTLTNG